RLPRFAEVADRPSAAVEDQRAVKAASGKTPLDDAPELALKGKGAAMSGLRVTRMQAKNPSLSVETLPRQGANLPRPHAGPVEPLDEIPEVRIRKPLSQREELAAFEEALAGIPFRERRHLRNGRDCTSLECERQRPAEKLQFPVDSGRSRIL